MIEHGRIRVENMNGVDHLFIWPLGFELSVDGEDIRISDNSGGSLSVGEEVRIGGGEAPLALVQVLLERPDCPGPYWVVGDIPVPR